MSSLTPEARDILLGIGIPRGDEDIRGNKTKKGKKAKQKEKKAQESENEQDKKLLRGTGLGEASASQHPGASASATDTIITDPAVARAEPSNSQAFGGRSSSAHAPLIIGLYGISGAGKTHLLNELAQTPLSQHLDFVDGSALIDRFVGLKKFGKMRAEEQNTQRANIMSALLEERRRIGKSIVIGGHMMFWVEATKKAFDISVEAEWQTYTHIVYLQVDPEVLYQRRMNDQSRNRGTVSVEDLNKWQTQERAALRNICYDRRIPFTTITEHTGISNDRIPGQVEILLKNFMNNDTESNLAAVDSVLDSVLAQHDRNLETMLVLDADKTLAPQDAGLLFWRFMGSRKGMPENSLDMILKPQGYSYASFNQVALLYQEVADDFDYMCHQVATRIAMHPEMTSLLVRVAAEPHAGAVVVTCGLRRVWEIVLNISGLTHVKVIGSGPLNNGYIVTDATKGHIVDRLKSESIRVVAFGDSAVDVDMLVKADESYVIVGQQRSRSTSMDSKLAQMIDSGCRPRQILLPAYVEPRLTEAQLPIVSLDETTMRSTFNHRFFHATSKASAKLLMTAMRDADVSGHNLRKAHEEVGYYLANEYLGDILGLESYKMKHVTGGLTDGYRFQGEDKTLIVPLMRGGEPMAFGVSKALKSASLVHSKTFADIDPNHFKVKETIILVDSVINSGQSVLDYLVPMRELYPKIKIVVVAGVVQAQAVEKSKDGKLGQALRNDPDLTVVALRKSDNKYRGTGTTDTGHRLSTRHTCLRQSTLARCDAGAATQVGCGLIALV